VVLNHGNAITVSQSNLEDEIKEVYFLIWPYRILTKTIGEWNDHI